MYTLVTVNNIFEYRLEQTLAEIREQYFDRVYEKQIKKLNNADKITRTDVLKNNLDASARQATSVGEELTAEEVPIEKTCGEFEEYNACGSPVFATCGVQPERRRGRAPRCIAGCFCKDGYVKLNGKCILPAECPVRPCLGSTEQYQECGTSCVLSCENLAKKDVSFTKQLLVMFFK